MEDKYFRLQLNLVRDLDPPVMIHTPHRDKKRGASRSMDAILEHKLDPSRVDICTWSPDDNEGSTHEPLVCSNIAVVLTRLSARGALMHNPRINLLVSNAAARPTRWRSLRLAKSIQLGLPNKPVINGVC